MFMVYLLEIIAKNYFIYVLNLFYFNTQSTAHSCQNALRASYKKVNVHKSIWN